jgi:hypothetical protein
MNPMIRARLVFYGGLGVLLATALAACGGGQAATPAASAPAASRLQVAVASASARGQGFGGEREGDGERARGEGGEGGESGEAGEGGPRLQRLAITVTDSGLQPASLSARAGVIEFDVTNKGQQPHDVAVTGNGTNGDSGMVSPGGTARFQGNLAAGSYQLKLDPTEQPSASTIPLTVR